MSAAIEIDGRAVTVAFVSDNLKRAIDHAEHSEWRPAMHCLAREVTRLSDEAAEANEQHTLTDEERDAVKLAADFLEDEFYGCSDKCAAEHNAVATLRKLLERMA